MRKGILSIIVCVMVAIGLLACGGGGGTGSNTNSAPVANAGPDQNISTGSLVTLSGSRSSDANGDMLTYTWSFTSKPANSTAALSSATVVNPTFTADKDGAYVLSLVVNDGTVNSVADSVTITAATANSAPVANAGPDQNVATGSQVTLNGSGSSDANGDMLTYTWSFTSKPANSTAALSSATVVNPTFTADKDGAYVLSLVINDGQVNSAADSVTITTPIANAGPDRKVLTGSLVSLDGSGSSNAAGDAVTYNWSFTSMPADSTATLSSTTVVNPTFTADKPGSYVLTLIVSAGLISSAADSITVTAADHLPPPDTGQATKYTTTFGEDADYSVNPPSYTNNGNGTITDNVTGLIWQRQDDGTTRTWTEANTYCSNNTPGLPGTGWRLPTRMELIGIVNYGTSAPAINTTYFPNTKLSYYWSSSTYASNTAYAWDVYFVSGFTNRTHSTTSSNYVRCVQGPSTPSSFTNNGDGTVTDSVTGLMWQKQDDGTEKTWEDALSYCENLSLASHTDWRLPNAKELSTLVVDTRNNPVFDPVFTSTQLLLYWSSTTSAGSTYVAWCVNSNSGETAYDYNGNKADPTYYYVRCMRGGQ